MKRSEQSLYKTGLIYHSDMLNHRCTWDVNHIEIPDRLKRSYDKCVERGLIDRCLPLEPRLASEQEIQLYHGADYIKLFTNCDQLDEDGLVKIAEKFDDVYVNQASYHAAMLSAGCCMEAAEAVLSKRCDNAIALVRPPGHHAMANEANGFCLFNNIVIVAKKALAEHNLERILIVDWDVHHGQGTQQAFYDDPRVLYFSIHRYENGLFWPNLRESDWDYIGDGKGSGFNVNVPLNQINMGDSEYINIFLKILLPLSLEFKPQLILVSAGYDCAIGCPEGRMIVTPACFAHLTQMLMSLSVHGQLCVLLEGGYCLESLEESVAMTLRTLLGDPCPPLAELGRPHSCVVDVILNLTNLLRNYWKCFESAFSFDRMLKAATKSPAFVPSVSTYLGKPVVLNVYPTRNKYPVRPQDEIDRFKRAVAEIVGSYKFESADYFLALGYDQRVQDHFNHIKDSPEAPYRLLAILKRLKKANLLKVCNVLAGRQATEEELCLAHDLAYIRQIQSWSADNVSFNNEDETYFCDATFVSASYAVGVCLNVVDSVLKGESQCGFALVRPPGHLASRSTCSNFCIFNNVAVAAKYAQNRYKVNKILIIDWDINFGSGTSEIFENDDTVMYISVHKCMEELLMKKCAESAKNDRKVNLCWNRSKIDATDSSYIFAFLNIILPLAYKFSPRLIFVSASFSSKGIETEKANLPWYYSFMTRLLCCLANSQLIMVLEEGYEGEVLKSCATSCIASMFGILPAIPDNLYSQTIAEEHLNNFTETIKHLIGY